MTTRRVTPGAAAAASAVTALSVAAAFTRPFTLAAGITVTLAYAGLAATLVAQRRVGTMPRMVARRPPVDGGPRRFGRRWLVWAVSLGSVAAFELASYLQGPRAAHPTLSAMLDGLDATPAGRGAAFAAWALLGWYLVTR
ncbi:MAG: hypothetical protein M0007_14720 [Actinomycetota bacterium]|nr:hypothetical protein [Actinomycetota bacterium]